MTQDEAYHCLLEAFDFLSKAIVNEALKYKYKTDIDYVLKAASPETVYRTLHEWARGDANGD